MELDANCGRGGAYVPARVCGLFMEMGRGGACVQMPLTHVGEWRGENQACRACTFDSPG